VLLQPRRAAARAIAQRIAGERGWTVGREVGWQVRFDARAGPDTRLLVVTEGILTARLQRDPLLSDFRTIVLDEFHERSIHADLAIALARQAWRARDDLRLVVMSATLDVEPVTAFLGGCPAIDAPGRLHPIDISYQEGATVASAARELLTSGRGDILCFLPGAAEIRRAMAELDGPARAAGVDLIPLHGSLDAAEQDRALASAPGRRIIVSTNIAETSVTVPGVTAVVDTGLHKVARYDADRAIDSLEVERITADAADQRAGRAGRVAPGFVRRLWSARDRLRPRREPEIHRVDLSATLLDVMAWGGDPAAFEWFEAPREGAVDRGIRLLERLGAVAGKRLTPIGERMSRLPLHPRLAAMLLASDGAPAIVRACALLSERHYFARSSRTTASDLLSAVDEWSSMPAHVQRAAKDIERLAVTVLGATARGSLPDVEFCRAVLAGYPDRVGERRSTDPTRVRLSSGSGAVLGPESGVREGAFLVAIDLQASTRPGRPDSIVRMASRIEREWLVPTRAEVVHRFDANSGTVRAARTQYYDALSIGEQPVEPDREQASRLLAEAWLERGPDEEDERILRRLRFAGRSVDLAQAIRASAQSARSIDELTVLDALTPDDRRALDRDAPETLKVPSGRSVRLDYSPEGAVTASVKLQELFGLADTPRIGPRREPVVFSLLAPSGRPVQVTRDLRSFWNRTYPEVRKELRARYPRHPWPEDPWNAIPTARPRRRQS